MPLGSFERVHNLSHGVLSWSELMESENIGTSGDLVRVGRVLIYGLIDPRNRELCYIGKTHKRRELRLKEHLEQARFGSRLPVHVWIRELLSQGYTPQTFVLERLGPKENWRIAEKSTLEKWRNMSEDLLPCVYPPKTPKSRYVTIARVRLLNVREGG